MPSLIEGVLRGSSSDDNYGVLPSEALDEVKVKRKFQRSDVKYGLRDLPRFQSLYVCLSGLDREERGRLLRTLRTIILRDKRAGYYSRLVIHEDMFFLGEVELSDGRKLTDIVPDSETKFVELARIG